MDVPPDFIDVHALIDQSYPQSQGRWFGYSVGLFLLVVLVSAFLAVQYPDAGEAVDLVSKLMLVTLIGVTATAMWMLVRRQRREIRQVEALEELVQLRRWPEAMGLAREILSAPARLQQTRAQTLILLSAILARYDRFEDAIAVLDHLLKSIRFDDGTAHGLRLARAMAMLREDHLVDADGAISELRRTSPNRDSAGLALIELYRDVKTGHPNEAIERFDAAAIMFRNQLGHRIGDAYGLLARAYDLLGKTTEAADAFTKATLLVGARELSRRYPEVAVLSSKYPAVPMPPGQAGIA